MEYIYNYEYLKPIIKIISISCTKHSKEVYPVGLVHLIPLSFRYIVTWALVFHVWVLFLCTLNIQREVPLQVLGERKFD